MAIEIKVPDMGESVIEATVARWMKREGDRIAAGEPVVELETDKINLEVGAQQAGVLQRIARQAGETVSVGDVLALVGEGEAVPSPAPNGEQPAAQAASSIPAASTSTAVQATPVAMRMAQEKGIDLVRIAPTGPGGRITKEDVESFLRKAPSETKETAPSTEQGAGRPAVAAGKSPQEISQPPARTATDSAQATAAASATAAPQQPPAAAPARSTIEDRETAGRETRVRLSRRRQTIARRLVEAQHTAAMLTTFNEIDMRAVMDLRKRRREEFKERFGVDLGFMPFFVRASVGALKAFPNVNAELVSSAQGDELILKHYYDIGIAIGAEEGLVVPVIRDADRLNFAGIEKAIRGFVEKSKNGALSLEDLRGGTFTITNGGVYGSLMSTPILNPPQVGILGMHAIKERPVVLAGQESRSEIVIRPMMYVALSYDHRVVDGREAVQFLVRIKEYVEDPEALLLG